MSNLDIYGNPLPPSTSIVNKYVITTDAVAISTAEAVRRHCTGSITALWWGIITHPTSGAKALVVPSNETANLPAGLTVQDSLPADWTPGMGSSA